MNYRIGVSEDEVGGAVLKKAGLDYTIVEPKKQFLLSVKKVLGKRYKRGASVLNDAPEFFDCSSLVAWAAVESGYAIPRISIDQFVFSKKIDKKKLQPGDLVFANTKKIISTEGEYYSKILHKIVKEEPVRYETLEFLPGTKVPVGVDHVGIYSGDQKIIHASRTKEGVVEEDIRQSEQFQNIVGYGRIIDDGPMRFVVEIPTEKRHIRGKETLLQELREYV